MWRSNRKSSIAVHTDASSPFSEAYRHLKVNIDFLSSKESKAIAVTSASPGEGKTTVSVHIAQAYAAGGKTVVLIDGDLRKPSLHGLVGRSHRSGLSDYLSDERTVLYDIIFASRIEGVSVITAGTLVPNPSDLLSSDKFDAMLQELKRRYDLVVVDTTPVLAAVDARIVAAKCDGTVFVIEKKMKRDIAQDALDELKAVKAEVLGAVLNKVNEKDVYKYPYYAR